MFLHLCPVGPGERVSGEAWDEQIDWEMCSDLGLKVIVTRSQCRVKYVISELLDMTHL